MGVRRAVEMAWRESSPQTSEAADRRVYTLGPLIHNPTVLADLEERGIKILKEGEILPDGSGRENAAVIIRAHGVSPAAETALAAQGVRILDATCPHVKASQKKARELSRQGFFIFLAGEKEHAEIIGIRGYVEGPCAIVANPSGAEEAAGELALNNPGVKTALLGQTTILQEEYFSIGERIKRYFPGLLIIDTICRSTMDKQNALRELSGQVDAFVIAGGRESANTRRLLSIAEGCGKKAWLVEDVSGIPPEVSSCSVIGLAAGDSTPDGLIDEIEEALKAI